ncbi:13492_t:CDS:2 [Ambispora gerdemannii]|uniref:13492_t:CDS:1 n=1 Tax=Ambispora gerdemannii TaxID=144530 RepID=A0A9N9CL52_9GLOM|nr:13492_t:CDS:2 [Ambispora gerdemannii]
MGRNKDLTNGECRTVEMLKKQSMSVAKITRILERSATSVKNCIKRIKLTQNCGYLKRKNSLQTFHEFPLLSRKTSLEQLMEEETERPIQKLQEERNCSVTQLIHEKDSH